MWVRTGKTSHFLLITEGVRIVDADILIKSDQTADKLADNQK
jgi:hypothetical protein